MSRYDGLIIPRSYSEYLNKTDSATLSQMLQQLTGLWSHAVSSGDNKPVTSDAVYEALTDAATIQQALQVPGVLSETVAAGDQKPVTSDAVNSALTNLSELNQLYDISHRPSSANIIPKKNKLSYMLATSAMTENKPISDGYIINLNWDNANILLQLFLPGSAEGRIGTRIKNNYGEWTDWEYYTKDSDIFYNYGNFTLIKENETLNSTESGKFTVTKNAIINITNKGSDLSTSELAWGRVMVGTLIIGGYDTLNTGLGTTVFIKAGTTFSYDLHNNDSVKLKISYKYVE